MKTSIDMKRFKFYLWVGLAYSVLWLFYDLAKYPGTFLPDVLNNLGVIWQVVPTYSQAYLEMCFVRTPLLSLRVLVLSKSSLLHNAFVESLTSLE